MKKYLMTALVVMITTYIFGHGAAADEIWLMNGDHLTGKIVRLEANSLVFNTGYAGEIAILVGLENSEMVKGILIISQQETPGIGDRITGDSFLNQFNGLNISDVALKRDGGQVDALSAATISSKAVADTVRETAMEKVELIEQGLN